MTTALSSAPVEAEQLDLLTALADVESPLGRLHADDFQHACRIVADTDGTVNPNHVSAYLHQRFGEINSRWLSAMWCSSCGPKGFLDKTDEWVPIDSTNSKGNGNKSVRLRRLRDAA